MSAVKADEAPKPVTFTLAQVSELYGNLLSTPADEVTPLTFAYEALSEAFHTLDSVYDMLCERNDGTAEADALYHLKCRLDFARIFVEKAARS